MDKYFFKFGLLKTCFTIGRVHQESIQHNLVPWYTKSKDTKLQVRVFLELRSRISMMHYIKL